MPEEKSSPTQPKTEQYFGGMSRRSFIAGGSALLAGAMLSRWAPAAQLQGVGGTLEIAAYEGFTTQKEAASWLKSQGLSVNSFIISTQDDLTAKLVGNPVRVDVAEYAYGYNGLYKQINSLTPLDVTKIPNYNSKNIMSHFFKGDTWFWDGKNFGIPWCWGFNSLVYNPAMVPKITTYKDLLKPELKGKLAFVDDPTASWPMFARLAGYGGKYPNLTTAELKDTFKQMEPYRQQARVFANSNGDVISLFVAGEIAACFCVWSAVPVQTALQGLKTEWVIPEEGVAVWADAWFIPMTAKNIEAAYAFINNALDPQVQADLCKNSSCGAMNMQALQHMDEATKQLVPYDDLDGLFAKSPLQPPPPQKSERYASYGDWQAAWSDFRSGF